MLAPLMTQLNLCLDWHDSCSKAEEATFTAKVSPEEAVDYEVKFCSTLAHHCSQDACYRLRRLPNAHSTQLQHKNIDRFHFGQHASIFGAGSTLQAINFEVTNLLSSRLAPGIA